MKTHKKTVMFSVFCIPASYPKMKGYINPEARNTSLWQPCRGKEMIVTLIPMVRNAYRGKAVVL